MNTVCCWDGGTDCCLFVRCRPFAWKRLTRNIFPPRGKGITGRESDLMPRKLSKLLHYAGDREDSLPDIGRELQRRARRALRSKQYGYVQVAMFAYKRLIMMSAGGLGNDSRPADDFVPTVDQNRRAPRRVHRTVDATHFSVFEIFVVQVIHDLLRHPHPWMRYLGADTLHALLACKESHSDAEKLLHSLLHNLQQDLAEAKSRDSQKKAGSSKFTWLWSGCNCKAPVESATQEEYEWALKARYASFCALYTSILKADAGMLQVHIQHTIPSILHVIEETWTEYNTQLRQLVHELKKGRSSNSESMFLRREATLLPLASLALSLLAGNTESARFDVLIRAILERLDQKEWQDLGSALHICRLTDVYNWHAYKMHSMALLQFPKNYNRANLYQFWSQYDTFLHAQSNFADADEESHVFNGVELTLEEMQLSLNSHSPCTQQVRQIARETSSNQGDGRRSKTATLEKWPHVTAWDGVLGISSSSLNRLLKSAANSKRSTDWQDELSRPFKHQLGKIIPPVADKSEGSKPAKSKWQRSTTGSHSLRYGTPVFVHLLRHLTHVNDTWESNGDRMSASGSADQSAFERQLHSSITVETSKPKTDKQVTSLRTSATGQDADGGNSLPRKHTMMTEVSKKMCSRDTNLASSSVTEDKGRVIPKQRQVDNLLRRGSTWVSNTDDTDSRDPIEGSTNDSSRITDTGEPKAWTWAQDNNNAFHSSFVPAISNTTRGATATRWRINTLEIVTRLVVESFALCEDEGASQLSESWFQESMEHLMPHLLELPADIVVVGNNKEITDNNSGSVPDTAFLCFLAFLMRCHQSSQISYVIHSICAWFADVQSEILVQPSEAAATNDYGVCESGSLLSPSPIFDCARLRILDALLIASRLRMYKTFAEQLESGTALDSRRIDKWIKQVEHSDPTSEGTVNTVAIARLVDREFEIAPCPESLFDLMIKELLSEQPWLRLRAFGILHANCSSPFTWLAHMTDAYCEDGGSRGSRTFSAPPPPRSREQYTASASAQVPEDVWSNVLCEDGAAINAVLSALDSDTYKQAAEEEDSASDKGEQGSDSSRKYRMLTYYAGKLGLRLKSPPYAPSSTKGGSNEDVTLNYPYPFSAKASNDSPFTVYHLHRLHMAIFNALCATTGLTISIRSPSVLFGDKENIPPTSRHPLQISRRVVFPLCPTHVGAITSMMRIVASLFSTAGSLEIWFASQLANQLDCAVKSLNENALPDMKTSHAIALLEHYRASLMCMVAVRCSMYSSSHGPISEQGLSAHIFSSILRKSHHYSSSLGLVCVGDEQGLALQEWVTNGALAPSDKTGPDLRIGYIPIVQFSPLNAGLRVRLMSWNTLRRVHEISCNDTDSGFISNRDFSFGLLRSSSLQTVLQKVSKDHLKTLQRYFPFVNAEWQLVPAIGKEYGFEYGSSVSKALEAYARSTSKVDANSSAGGFSYSPTKTRRSLLDALTRTSEDDRVREELPSLSSLLNVFYQTKEADSIFWPNPIAVYSAGSVDTSTLVKWAPYLVNIFTTYRETSPDYSVCEILTSMVDNVEDCSALILLLLSSSLPALTLPEIFETSTDQPRDISSTTSERSPNAGSAFPKESSNVEASNERHNSPESGQPQRGMHEEDDASGRDQIKKNPSAMYAGIEDPETWSVFTDSKPKIEVTRMLSMATISSEEEGHIEEEEPPQRRQEETSGYGRRRTPPEDWVMFRLAGGSLE